MTGLILAVVLGRVPGPFRDVPRDHWAFQATTDLRAAGILVGYPPEPDPTTLTSLHESQPAL